MSELTATNCGCGCDNGCANSCGCGGNGNGCGLNNSCLWIILLLCCCGGWGVMVVADVVMATAMTVVCGSSFFFAAAADGAIMDSDAAVAVMAATVADADICSFFHFKWGMRKNRMPLLAYLFKRFGFPVTTLCSALFSSDVIFFSFSSPSFFFNIHFSSISYTAFPSIINFLDIFVYLSSSYY